MTEQPDEIEMIPCANCRVPIETRWAANGQGLRDGDYVLIGDTIWHPKCWDEQVAKFPVDGQTGN